MLISIPRFLSTLVLVSMSLVGALELKATSEDERFLDGLRARRLFLLAESYCRQRLADDGLSDVDRALLTGELIRCYAGKAVNSPPQDREQFWQLASETATEFERDHKDNPRLVLVRVQNALTVLARGELHRQEAEVLADPTASLEAAKTAIRDAARLLEQLDQELTREIPLRHRGEQTPGEFSVEELLSLQHNVRYQLARAFRNRALCYPKSSDDRVAALTGAVDELKKPLTQIATDDPLVPRIQIDLAVCFRLLGNFADARQVLDSTEQSQPEPRVRLRASAETVRLQVDQNQPRKALEALMHGRELDGQISAELDFAHLETYIALWKGADAAGDQEQVDSWRKKAVAMVKLIEQTHGPYWGRRSDLLLVNSVGGSHSVGDVDILVRTADNLYRKDQYEEAILAYEKAAEVALGAGNVEQAFQLRYRAALVEHVRKRHQQASQKLRDLGREMKSHPKAPDAHLLAAWNAAQWSRSDAQGLPEYAEILQEHTRLWQQGKTADMARVWLGRLRESKRDWQAAIESYQAVSADHGQLDEAAHAAARCWTNRLDAMKAQNEPYDDLARTAAEYFEKQISHVLAAEGQKWTTLDRFCAEQAARVRLQYTADGHAQAESVLQAAIDGPPDPDPTWKTAAQSLLVVALAGQPMRRAEAEQVLTKIGSSSPERLLEMLKGLAAIADSAQPRVKQELANLQLAVVDKLWAQRSQVEQSKHQMLQRIRAEALVLAGRRSDALTAYAELAKENPNSGTIQEAYAELLLDGDDEESWQGALDQWRRVASRSKSRTDRWYKAKYSVALALFKLGNKPEAANRIRYLQANPPGLEGTSWKDRFLELLQRCEGR